MTDIWLLALMSRDTLRRDAERVASRYRDVVCASEVLSAVHIGMVEAVARFDPNLGRFRDWARPFVERAVLKAVRRELRWRRRRADYDVNHTIDPRMADVEAYRRELKDLLGDDYEVFMSHYAYGESMRALGRATNRSFRSVREAIGRADRRVYEHLDHEPGAERRRRHRAHKVPGAECRGPARPPKS